MRPSTPGFKHGIYEGTPYFAVDVTPKGTVEKEASGIIEEMKKKGLNFLEGRVNMSLAAPDGKFVVRLGLCNLKTRIALECNGTDRF